MPLRFVGAALVVAMLVTGCGVPPELRPKPGAEVPVPSSVPQTSAPFPPGFSPRPATPSPAPTPTTSPFPLTTAVACNGRPSTDQVIALVKRETPIEPTAAFTAPVCSGTWHYTVLEVPGRDPLQVLSKTEATGLDLVAYGTDVCSVDIRRQAPTGILLASC